jgi:hypothetical protein
LTVERQPIAHGPQRIGAERLQMISCASSAIAFTFWTMHRIVRHKTKDGMRPVEFSRVGGQSAGDQK